MRIEHLRSFGEESLLHQVDHALHRLTLIDRVGDHRLGPCGEANRLVRLGTGDAIGRIGIIIEDDNLVVAHHATELDQLCADHGFGRLDELDDDELRSLAEALDRFERRVSGERQEVFAELDDLTDELVIRYREQAGDLIDEDADDADDADDTAVDDVAGADERDGRG